MAKSTPHFNDMMAARGGMGANEKPAPKAPKPMPKVMPKPMPKGSGGKPC